MKVKIKVYDNCKYDTTSSVVAECHYNIKGYEVKKIAPTQIHAEGFDEIDPYDEYLIIRTMDDKFYTFRNSFVDIFAE